MFEFNPDGSLKLPEAFLKKKEDEKQKMISQRCIKIKKEIVSFNSPKKCVLRITLSDYFNEDKFIHNIHRYFRETASVPSSLRKINDREFEVEIGTDYKRCTDCCALVNAYREFLDGNMIEDKGGCTFEGFKRSFAYEDYFD